jgi:hypothetical protein
VASSFNLGVTSQRLFYRGAELTDDHASMADIKLMTNSTIYLKEAVMDADKEEEEEEDIEFGFSGTKLHLSSRVRMEPKIIDAEVGRLEDTSSMQQDGTEIIKDKEVMMDVMINESDILPTINGRPGSPMTLDSRVVSKAPTPVPEPLNACHACTFINKKGAESCEICDSLLEDV